MRCTHGDAASGISNGEVFSFWRECQSRYGLGVRDLLGVDRVSDEVASNVVLVLLSLNDDGTHSYRILGVGGLSTDSMSVYRPEMKDRKSTEKGCLNKQVLASTFSNLGLGSKGGAYDQIRQSMKSSAESNLRTYPCDWKSGPQFPFNLFNQPLGLLE